MDSELIKSIRKLMDDAMIDLRKKIMGDWRHIKVHFQGEEYWLHDYNLSPLDHYDESGKLTINSFHDISYAVIEDGKIMRYGKQIGLESEMELV
jgi:hemerythrin